MAIHQDDTEQTSDANGRPIAAVVEPRAVVESSRGVAPQSLRPADSAR